MTNENDHRRSPKRTEDAMEPGTRNRRAIRFLNRSTHTLICRTVLCKQGGFCYFRPPPAPPKEGRQKRSPSDPGRSAAGGGRWRDGRARQEAVQRAAEGSNMEDCGYNVSCCTRSFFILRLRIQDKELGVPFYCFFTSKDFEIFLG